MAYFSLLPALLLLSLSMHWLAIFLGSRLGLIDVPDQRKKHDGEITLAGGIGIYLSFIFATLVLQVAPYTTTVLSITSVVFALALYDDRYRMGAVTRLFIHYASGIALATMGGIAIHNAGNLLSLGDIPLLVLTVPLTALSVAGLCNAYNMIDGIDGLAAGTILLPLLILFGLAASRGHPMSYTLLAMVVPVLVFLFFNLGANYRLFPKIFLGDGGSVTMGFLVTASLVYFSQGDGALIRPVTALWLVTIPLMDMIATMLRRWKRGRKLMAADRSHLHHTLMNRGLNPTQTLVVILAYATVCAFTGVALERTSESLSLFLYFLLFLAHCAFVIASDSGREQSVVAVDD